MVQDSPGPTPRSVKFTELPSPRQGSGEEVQSPRSVTFRDLPYQRDDHDDALQSPRAVNFGAEDRLSPSSGAALGASRKSYFQSEKHLAASVADEEQPLGSPSSVLVFHGPFDNEKITLARPPKAKRPAYPPPSKHKVTLSTDNTPYSPYSKNDTTKLSSWTHRNLSSMNQKRRQSTAKLQSTFARKRQQSVVAAKEVSRSAKEAFRRVSLAAVALFDNETTEIWHVNKDNFEKETSTINIKELRIQQYNDSEEKVDCHPSAYTIQRIAALDDMDLRKTWQRIAYKCSPMVLICSQVLFWGYFVLRILFTVSTQKATNSIYPLAWLFLFVECLVALPGTFNGAWQILSIKQRSRPKLRLLGNFVPTVDVFVTCCSEETDLVMDTVLAACTIDWPQDRFRVIILDDGGSKELETAARAEKEKRFPNLFYHARVKVKGQPHHFKAGNLNGGLAYVDDLPGGQGEFFAALDADMICTKDWLRGLVPHLLVDSRLCMSCPPQLFYNTPKGDLLHQSLDYFVHVAESLKDSLGVAWCTGSGYVVRRIAMADIGGGFPYGSLAEDVCFSSMLLGAGWRSAYVHEPLQFGLVPDSFEGHIKQRTRWTIGTIQTAIKLKFCMWGPLAQSMTIPQRICGVLYTAVSFFYIFLTIALFTIPIVLLSGGTMIAYRDAWQLRTLLRVYFADLVVFRISEVMLFQASGYYTGKRGGPNALWMSPYYSITIIRSFLLPKWLGGNTMAFKPSGSQKSDLNERDKRLRAPLWTRIRVMVFNNLVWFHVLQILFCIAGVIYSSVRCALYINSVKVGGCMIAHAAWAPLAWLATTAACWTPIHYTLFPPTMPDREELLERDEEGVAQPKASAIRKSTQADMWSHGFEFVSTLILAVGLVYLALSFVLPDNIVNWRF